MSRAHVTIARGGTLVLGGGFGGAYVARLLAKRGATIVSPDSSMLYTPLLAEVAAGAIEPRHVAVPLRMMCPHAELMLGRAVHLDESKRRVTVETELGHTVVEYERLVVAVGAIARMLPVPGLADHGLGFKNLADAIALRNHILGKLDAADADPSNAQRHLAFVFVGAGYAGVEALAELMDLVGDAMRHYPRLKDVPQRWVLVNGGPKILAEVPEHLSDYAANRLCKRGVDIRLSTSLDCVEENSVRLSDGTRLETNTLVWTAGVKPNPVVERLGLPLDERGRVQVDSSLRVEGADNIWALGDCAAVPNEATPERPDPPTCQHALRQARRLAKNLRGEIQPYRYRSLGQAATLGRDRGIASVLGIKMRGLPGSLFARSYHLYQLPLRSRRLRVLADGVLSYMFARDITQLGLVQQSLSQASAAEDPLGRLLA
ncbi:MAG TPA: NAD(P)/FAD-dependent oxidoreductase [Candidatus Dormibacteraeota bacterium]|nr:NAD(P)/FAD-dependent oxidoreductase [Candidatus Dormibacteraeota bacterium]